MTNSEEAGPAPPGGLRPSSIDTAFEAISDRYRVEREVGSGGMATVYLAEDRKHRRQVALKVLKPDIAEAIGRERFLREIEIAARLNHPHVLPLFDSGAAGRLLYYVMPYIAGESLRTRLTREPRLPVDDALRLTREIASALGHAHQHGLVHRDVKPENILLAEGIALVADFGIAHTVGDLADEERTQVVTGAGAVLGTPQYMSPEQAGGGAVDARSDIYSLACVLFEMLAGQPPFVAPTAGALLRMHVAAEPRPVTDLRPSVPGGVARALVRGLAKLPADRFATAAQFAEALTTASTGTTAPTAAPSDAGPPNNLPRQRTHFIGRERELADCGRLLKDTRMLTLTGIGGCGKTRLALEFAGQALPTFPDGVWFVDLAPLSEGGRLVETVGAALGVREVPGRDLTASLRERVRGKRMLLILDNCEHLLAAAADLADLLLETGDELRILVTSREGLGIEGERLFALRSLPVPGPDAGRDPHAVASSAAVRLFVDRAQRVVREFALTAENAEAIAEICCRLDGIPLAIELAAARVKVLSVDQIRARLDDRFRLLTGGSKTALPRHQTLQATIQWSYDQLSSGEQRLLRLLSVFAGGWTLEAAARLAGDEADEFEILDLLSRLVDKSLVLVDRHQGGDTRYSLLETVRQYARERLADSSEVGAARQRHAQVFLAIAERAYRERITREDKWSAVLEVEHDNLRTALDILRDADAERHLQLAGALAWFWQGRSYLLEGREQLTAALAASSPGPARSARARGLWGAASVLVWQGDPAGALNWMEEALQMWRDLGEVGEVAPALEGVGWAQFFGGEDEKARVTFEECLRLHRASGDPHLVNRAMIALAQVLVALDRVEEARAFAQEILEFSRSHEDRRGEHSAWHFLADCALIEGDCGASLSLYRRSLVLAQGIGDRLETGFEVQGVAMSLAGRGDAEQALRLAAATEAEWERLGAALRIRFWSALLDRYLGQARRALGEAAADRVWIEGRQLPFDDAVVAALQAAGGSGPLTP